MLSGVRIIRIPFIFPWFASKRQFKVVFSDSEGMFLKYEIGNCRITIFGTNIYDITADFKLQLKTEIRRRKRDKVFINALKKDFYIGPHVLLFEMIIRCSKILYLMLAAVIIAETFKKRG